RMPANAPAPPCARGYRRLEPAAAPRGQFRKGDDPMRRARTFLTTALFAAVVAALIACTGIKVQTFSGVPSSPATQATKTTGRGKFWGPPPTGPTVAISAKQLCQELLDDPKAGYFRYCKNILEVEGVVSERHVPDGFRDPGPEDPLGAVIFLVPVTD